MSKRIFVFACSFLISHLIVGQKKICLDSTIFFKKHRLAFVILGPCSACSVPDEVLNRSKQRFFYPQLYKNVNKDLKDTLKKYSLSFNETDTVCFFDWDPQGRAAKSGGSLEMNIVKRVARINYTPCDSMLIFNVYPLSSKAKKDDARRIRYYVYKDKMKLVLSEFKPERLGYTVCYRYYFEAADKPK